MAYQPEAATWEAGVLQLETTTPVLGGVGGASNTPLLHLANRTLYLKGQVDSLNTAVAGLAPTNSPAFTGSPTTPDVALGDRSTKIANTKFVQDTIDGVLSKSVAGGVDVTLSAVEAGNGSIILTGLITANINVNVPVASHKWIVSNQTTGAFTVTYKTTGGTGVVVTQGRDVPVWSDGTNVRYSHSDFISIALTGTPTTPTASPGDNSTKVASTAYVDAAVAGATGVSAASETVQGKVELATAAETLTGTDNTRAVHPAGLASVLGNYAPIASPALTGNPTAPTQTAGNNTTRLATTAFVATAIAGLGVSSASETVQGKVELATAAETATGTDNTRAVHPAGLKSVTDLLAPRASPTFTGVPAAPTATGGTNTTQIATTAFVTTALASFSPTIADASETVKGKVELATAAETATGTDNTRAVHPAGLKSITDLLAPTASPTLTGTPAAPTAAAGTSTTQIATTSFVATRGASMKATANVTIAGPGTLAADPTCYTFNVSTDTSYSLPQLSTVNVSDGIYAFLNLSATKVVTLNRSSTDQITTGAGNNLNGIDLKPGSCLILIADKTAGRWRAVGGTAQFKYSDEFKNSIGASTGYHKLPGGLLLQWTQVLIASAGVGQSVSFPTSFANINVNVWTQALNGSSSAVQAWHTTPSASAVQVWCDAANYVDVFAIGLAP